MHYHRTLGLQPLALGGGTPLKKPWWSQNKSNILVDSVRGRVNCSVFLSYHPFDLPTVAGRGRASRVPSEIGFSRNAFSSPNFSQ